MEIPQIPHDERQRLTTLRILDILDTPPDQRFDRLTRLAQRVFDVPIALVSLVDVDRQWFKSRVGLDATETGRDISFCGHSILGDETFIVNDASQDPRFADNPLVTGEPGIRFYAGCPLRLSSGSALGTLCLIDRRPRNLGPEDLQLLTDLAAVAECELAALRVAALDDLTQLANRRGFVSVCKRAIHDFPRTRAGGTLAYFDLDGFKPVNDRYGHAEGDRALRKFGELLQESFPESEIIGRLGGDEFAVLLPGTCNNAVSEALGRLWSNLERYNRQADRGYDLGCSVGTANIDARTDSVETLMEAADQQMYRHKRSRRSQLPVRAPRSLMAMERLAS